MLKNLYLPSNAAGAGWRRLLGPATFSGAAFGLLWLGVTLLFLYERTYLIQKAGLPHFVACVVVRAGLLMALCYGHLRLAGWLLPRRRYGRYLLLTALALGAYLLLQGSYDRYLFGFVIGDRERTGLWQNLPYNLLVTGWYLLLTYLVARRLPAPAAQPAASAPASGVSAAEVAPAETGSTEVVIRTEGEWRRLPVASIRYAQGLKDYTVLHTDDGRHVVKGSIGKVAEWLPAGHFVRVHKSYLVARQRITAVSSTEVKLAEQAIPIGRAYAEQLADFKRNGPPGQLPGGPAEA